MRTVDPEQWMNRKPKHVVKTLPLNYHIATTFEMRLRESLMDAIYEMFDNCSACGVRLINKHSNKSTRYIYSLVYSALVLFAIYMIVSSSIGYSTPTMVVNLQSDKPNNVVVYPAIAICSHNVISRKELEKFAWELVSLDKNNTYTIREIRHNLMAFGALITRNRVQVHTPFMRFLTDVANENNVTHLMFKLGPKCDDMLVRCRWMSTVMACRELFATRLTSQGFCCVMNSRYRSCPEDSSREPITWHTLDRNNELRVVMRENTDDFTYLRRPGPDTEVILFDGSRFPLEGSDGLRSYSVQRNSNVVFFMTSLSQDPDETIKYYSEDWRGCYVPVNGKFRQYSDEIDCILECLRNAVHVLCSCVPFNLMPKGDQTLCTTEHLHCLRKHREMLMNYFPTRSVSGLEEEYLDSVNCPDCLPPCSRTLYSARLSYVNPTAPARKMYHGQFLGGYNLVNTSVIRFVLMQEDASRYVLEARDYWFQLVAWLGAVWVCVGGAGLACLLEVLFFLSVRWCRHYNRRYRQHCRRH